MSSLIYSTVEGSPRWLSVTMTVLRFLVAAFFVFMAGKNLGGDTQIASDFARWGYPGWFRVLTAVFQILGALLLVLPATTFYGAGLLAGILVGAIWTHLRFDPPAAALSPAVFLAPVLAFLVTYRPPLLR